VLPSCRVLFFFPPFLRGVRVGELKPDERFVPRPNQFLEKIEVNILNYQDFLCSEPKSSNRYL
jgi:hypothetical protein